MQQNSESIESESIDGGIETFLSFSKDHNTQEEKKLEGVHTRPPWLRNFSFEHSAYALQNLHNECLEFCRFISLTEEEIALRSSVINEVQCLIRQEYPQARVQYFGSQLSKTTTPSSDLDLVVLNVDETDSKNHLITIAEILKRANIVSYLEIISTAKVPIVKFDHRASSLSVDILVNNDDGLRSGKLVQRLSREFPPLRALIIVLKTFLSQRKLNDTYTGGIGSFVLSVMIVSFLQHRQKLLAFQQIENGTWNLATLLLDFFYLYGTTFNYEEVGISIVDGGSYFPKRSRQWYNPQRPSLLAIENPLYPDIDMGKSSYNINRIKRTFDHAYQVLLCAMSTGPVPSLLSYIIRPDHAMFASRQPNDFDTNISSLNEKQSRGNKDISNDFVVNENPFCRPASSTSNKPRNKKKKKKSTKNTESKMENGSTEKANSKASFVVQSRKRSRIY